MKPRNNTFAAHLLTVGHRVIRDSERTEYAQRKVGRGIRLETRRRVCVIARTVRTAGGAEGLPVTAYQMARYS